MKRYGMILVLVGTAWTMIEKAPVLALIAIGAALIGTYATA